MQEKKRKFGVWTDASAKMEENERKRRKKDEEKEKEKQKEKQKEKERVKEGNKEVFEADVEEVWVDMVDPEPPPLS